MILKVIYIIFSMGRVTSLQSWVAKKSCHGQTLINECSIFDYPTRPTCNILFKTVFCFAFLRSYIFISDQKVKAKSNRNKNCIFHFLGNPKGRTLDHIFYASHIRHDLPYKLIPISMNLLKYF